MAWGGLQHACLLTIPSFLVRPGSLPLRRPEPEYLSLSPAPGAVAGQIIPWNFPILVAVGGPGWMCAPDLALNSE